MSLADPAEVRVHLVAAAAGHPLTYGELLAQLGHGFTRPKMRALCKTLTVVDRETVAQGEPELAVLVVRQSDGLPGQGWWIDVSAEAHGYAGPWEGPLAVKLVRELQQRAFDHWGSSFRSP